MRYVTLGERSAPGAIVLRNYVLTIGFIEIRVIEIRVIEIGPAGD